MSFSPVALTLLLAFGMPTLAQTAGEEPRRAAAVPPRAAAAGALQVDAGPDYFVVTDPARRTVGVYRVGTSSISFVGARNVDTDLVAEPAGNRSPVPIPGSDSPGEDPPGFVRPKGAVRIEAQYHRLSATEEHWRASYLVGSSVEAVYAEIRDAHRGGQLNSSDVSTYGLRKSARLGFVRDGSQFEIDLGSGDPTPDFHVRVNVLVRATKKD